MNPKLARTLCEGESTYKSRGAPHLIARTWLLMASRGDRSPRLTLQAGRREGGKARSQLRFHRGFPK